MKKMLHGFGVLGVVLGLLFTADLVLSGSFEDSFTRTYILPNLSNFATANLSSTQLRGRIAFDSTLNVPTSDDGTGWRPMMTRYLSRTASHIEVTNASVPTLGTCTGGSVRTGSTDTSGEITGTTAATCIVNFNNFYNLRPFGVASSGAGAPGNSQIVAEFFTTGINVRNLSGSGSGHDFSYVVIGRY